PPMRLPLRQRVRQGKPPSPSANPAESRRKPLARLSQYPSTLLPNQETPMTTTTLQTSNRLSTIATRQRKNRIRDAFFAACVALAASLAIITVSTATHAASTSQLTQR